MQMMSKGVVSVIATFLLIAVLGGAWYHQNQKKAEDAKALENLKDVYGAMLETLDEFHRDLKGVSASAAGKSGQMEELRKMKNYAAQARDRLSKLSAQAHETQTAKTPLLEQGIEKTDKYLSSFEDLSNLSVTKETLTARSETMLQNVCIIHSDVRN